MELVCGPQGRHTFERLLGLPVPYPGCDPLRLLRLRVPLAEGSIHVTLDGPRLGRHTAIIFPCQPSTAHGSDFFFGLHGPVPNAAVAQLLGALSQRLAGAHYRQLLKACLRDPERIIQPFKGDASAPPPTQRAGLAPRSPDQPLVPIQPHSCFNKLAIISVSRLCNHACVWCTEGDVHSGELAPLSDVDEVLGRLAAQGYDSVNFMGAETTVRSDVPELFKLVHRHGLRIALTTNGIRFANEKFARNVLPYIDALEFSFPTTDADDYEFVSGRPHLAIALRAFERVCTHAEQHPMALTLNVVTGSANRSGPTLVTAHVAARAPNTPLVAVQLLRARREGMASQAQLLDLVDCGEAFRPALKIARDAGIVIGFRGLPPCILTDEISHNLYVHDFLTSPDITYLNKQPLAEGVTITDKANLDRQGRVRPEACLSCDLQALCPGVDPDVPEPARQVRPQQVTDLDALQASVLNNPAHTVRAQWRPKPRPELGLHPPSHHTQ